MGRYLRNAVALLRSVVTVSSRVLLSFLIVLANHARAFLQIGLTEGPSEPLWSCCELCHVLVSQFLEVGVFETLRCSWPIISIISQHFQNDLLGILAYMWDQFCYALEFALGEL